MTDPITPPTRIEHGFKIMEALNALMTRYSAPVRQAPSNEIADAKMRVDEAVDALQALTGSRFGLEPSVPCIEPQLKVAGINLLLKEVRALLYKHLGSADYEITIPGRGKQMRNIVDYQTYTVLCTVTSENKKFVLACNPKAQYIFSEYIYWASIAYGTA